MATAVCLAVKTTSAQAPEENPLLVGVRDELRRANPALTRVVILELRRASPRAPYVVIGYGVRRDRPFAGDFRDELFGIFVANESLARITRTLEIIQSQRWLDYMVRIERITDDESRRGTRMTPAQQTRRQPAAGLRAGAVSIAAFDMCPSADRPTTEVADLVRDGADGARCGSADD